MVRVFGISANPEIIYRHLLPGHARESYPSLFATMFGDVGVGIRDLYSFFDVRVAERVWEPIVHPCQRREFLETLVSLIILSLSYTIYS